MKRHALLGLLLPLLLPALLTACATNRQKDATMVTDLPDQAFTPPTEETGTANVEQARQAASDGLFWFLHPCGQMSGVPYRKYHSFAMDVPTGIIYGRTSETATPIEIKDKPPGAVAWESVNQFFEVKGITKACAQAGGAQRPDRGQPQAPAKDEDDDRDDRQSQSPHQPFQAPVNLDKNLYYANIQQGGQGDLFLKRRLYEFLGQPHIQAEGKTDHVVSACPADLNPGEVCVKPRVYDYKEARVMLFGDVDLRKTAEGEYEVFDYYCQQWKGKEDFSRYTNNPREMPGPGQIVHSKLINVEHSFPQSKFPAPKGSLENMIQKTDLHHIFPTDTEVNRIRGNYEFADVEPDTAQAMKCADGRLGSPVPVAGATTNGAAKYFEPPRAFKGDIARALAYFSVRYNAGMSTLQEAYIRKWNQEDPPGDEEIARNEKIYRLIGVRNPFVDDPRWMDQIKRFCREKLSADQGPSPFDCQ